MSQENSQRDCFSNLIGKELNHSYRIVEKLSAGGMSAVFLATQLQLGNRVAIKVISPELVVDPTFVKRFQREARVGRALLHPNIVKVYESNITDDGLLYMVMELVEGETLSSYMERMAPIPAIHCLEILRPICNALDTAHKRNILHRDLKPGNILVKFETGKEIVKLADFGIVKLLQPDNELTDGSGSNLTEIGQVFGTPEYMSPEQLMSYPVGPTSDIYSLGVILYEMLTGHLPIECDDFRELFRLKTAQDGLPPPSSLYTFLPVAFDQVLEKALAPVAQQRYQTAGELLNAFQTIVEQTAKSYQNADSPQHNELSEDKKIYVRPTYKVTESTSSSLKYKSASDNDKKIASITSGVVITDGLVEQANTNIAESNETAVTLLTSQFKKRSIMVVGLILLLIIVWLLYAG
ncbi:MAG: serine/threonine-protein kinase [Acidobacteriota bacterium]